MPKPKKPPLTARPGKPPQTIRGGFIVVRRNDRTGRLLTMHGTAYEHGSAAAAKAQAAVLAERFGCEFAVFCEVASVVPQSDPNLTASESVPEFEATIPPKARTRPVIRLRSPG